MTNLDWHAGQGDAEPTWLQLLDAAPESVGIDLAGVRRYRRDQLRQEMETRDISALILSDPVNIRYATGSRNMQIFTARNTPSRYLLLTPEDSILYEFTGCEHLSAGLETIDEIRPAVTASFVAAGPAVQERELQWAAAMAATIADLVGPGMHRVGVERMNAGAATALRDTGLQLVDAQEPVEMARAIKSRGEIDCIKTSLRMTEKGVGALRAALRPGVTENELWSILHAAVIAGNGDYCETRLLNSGSHSNPWFQETSSRTIRANELVALDTDVVGCHGYYSDFSRTFPVGPAKPSSEQRTIYQLAFEQVHHNMDIIGPGVTFREYSEKAWDIPAAYHGNRYYLSAHGCGMTGEYPYLYHHADFDDAGYDGEILPGMTLCVESYIGAPGGQDGVKLEQQLLVTGSGTELLSQFPFEESLL